MLSDHHSLLSNLFHLTRAWRVAAEVSNLIRNLQHVIGSLLDFLCLALTFAFDCNSAVLSIGSLLLLHACHLFGGFLNLVGLLGLSGDYGFIICHFLLFNRNRFLLGFGFYVSSVFFFLSLFLLLNDSLILLLLLFLDLLLLLSILLLLFVLLVLELLLMLLLLDLLLLPLFFLLLPLTLILDLFL